MENKKLLKFLLKDIAEIEELFAEKGNSGFDAFEIDFIRSRFEGAKKIVSILEEQQGNPQIPDQETQSEFKETNEDFTNEPIKPEMPVHEPENESLEPEPSEEIQETESEIIETIEETETSQEDKTANEKEEVENVEDSDNEEPELIEPQRLGDKFTKEKSLNDLLSNGGSNKLENKLSNSPVSSLQGAIGINDRYIFIRELFEGNADSFSKAVSELDKLQNIQEAVTYLQQNYKWKKTDTSLKFVNLVKRRFPNG